VEGEVMDESSLSGGAKHIGQAVGGALLLALSIYALIEGVNLELWAYGGPGPGLFPFMLSVLLAPMAAIFMVMSLWRLTRPAPGPAQALPPSAPVSEPVEEDAAEGPLLLWKVVAYVAGMGFFAATMDILGWKLSLAAVLLFLLCVVERLGWLRGAAYSALFLGCSYLLFERALNVPLPKSVFW